MKDKTEFLFESDAEKVIIKNAVEEEKKKIKKSLYKKIIKNSLIMSVFLIVMLFGCNYIMNARIDKLSASIKKSEETDKLAEVMNNSSNTLEYHDNTNNNKYEILINKANAIDEIKLKDYKIVDVEDNIFDNIKLEEETYNNYLELKKNLNQKNYYINIRSGYRTFEESEAIFNEYKNIKGLEYANNYVAKPGCSEHNTGLALDITVTSNKEDVATNYDSDEYFYFENIIYLYGFVLRYPKDKEDVTGYAYEPWHIRYVGKDLAKYLKKNNLTLEEYYEMK